MPHSQFFEEILYPLQDGILRVCKDIETTFYLTGGTALSREYYHHRYSDDLDFFTNNDKDFTRQVKLILSGLRDSGFTFDENSAMSSGTFTSLYVSHPKCSSGDVSVKLDFVNDIDVHYGGIHKGEITPRVDSVRNILSNKISAIFRYAAKDIVDIREIALHEQFSWLEIIDEARNKDIGIQANIVSQIISSTPKSAVDSIAWTGDVPDWEKFKTDIIRIGLDIERCDDNSLCVG